MFGKRSWKAFGFVVAAGCASAGCVAHAQAGGYGDANAPVFTEPPTLVNVDSDVWVVQDASEPVYYVDGYYWTNGGGVWRRTRFYDKDWSLVEFSAVPASIARRDHRSYVRYHGVAGARTKPAPREGVAAQASPHDERGNSGEHRQDGEKNGHKDDRPGEHADRKEEHGDHQDSKATDHADRKDDKGGPHDHDGKPGGGKRDRKDDKRDNK